MDIEPVSEKICESPIIYISEVDKALYFIDENGYLYKNYIRYPNPLQSPKVSKYWMMKHGEKCILACFLNHILSFYEINHGITLIQQITISSIRFT